jgi:hypothetical protein
MARKLGRPPYQAAEGSGGRSYRLPAYGSPIGEPPGSSVPEMRMPGVDDRLAIPESGEEYFDGIRYEVMAGEPEHADPQCQLAYVARACVAEGYVASTELLTRSDVGSDFATDVCVRRQGTDPRTGQRYLEELSFEVANTQTLKELGIRAKKLVARGVRRLFAVMVQEEEIHEWEPRGGWKVLSRYGEIRDRAFHKPLRVRAILNAAEADRLVSAALVAKKEPHLMKTLEEREAKGREEGRKETLRGNIKDLCEVLNIDWSTERKAALQAMKLSDLDALWVQLVTDRDWPSSQNLGRS